MSDIHPVALPTAKWRLFRIAAGVKKRVQTIEVGTLLLTLPKTISCVLTFVSLGGCLLAKGCVGGKKL